MNRNARLSEAALGGAWRRLGVRPGDILMVHAALSSFGTIEGGAEALLRSLRTAVGPTGTLVMPAFTPQIADPVPSGESANPRTLAVQEAVPLFSSETPSQMGALAEALRRSLGTLRSSHPQVSVVAQGRRAAEIIHRQSLGYAVGPVSPFGTIREMGSRILLLGVGHNRNTFLHHAEYFCPHRRRKLRRFPLAIEGERVWVEAPDVADDLDTLFPLVGESYEALGADRTIFVGNAKCTLLEVEHFVSFAIANLEHHLIRMSS